MKQALHSYPWYSADWLQSDSRASMTLAQRGLFRDLIDMLMHDGGSLPANEPLLMRKSLCEPEEWAETWPVVRQEFEERGGRLYHRKATEVHEKIETYREKRSLAGQNGGRKSRCGVRTKLELKSDEAKTNSSLTRAELELNSSLSKNELGLKPSTTTTTSTTTTNARECASDIVTRIIDRHPKQGKRTLCENLLSELTNGGDDAEKLARIDANHAAWCEEWATWENQRFIPALPSWLGDGSWRDPPKRKDDKPKWEPEPAWMVRARLGLPVLEEGDPEDPKVLEILNRQHMDFYGVPYAG